MWRQWGDLRSLGRRRLARRADKYALAK